MNKVMQEGFDSFSPKKMKLVNPYKVGTQEYNDFERGWIQALKRWPEIKLNNK